MQDLKFVLRTLAKAPLHAATVVVILAVGIGVNTAIFSLVQSVLLNPLPYPDGGQLVLLTQSSQGRSSPFSWPNYQDVRASTRSFSDIALYQRGSVTLTGQGVAQQISRAIVEAPFFRLLGVQPLLGRTFAADEDRPGGPRVVVLRESLWRQRFNADPAVLGRTVTLDGEAVSIIGVMPNDIISPTGVEMWMPLGPSSTTPNWQSRRNQPGLFALGRLKAGVSLEQARAELTQIGQRLQRDYPNDNIDTLPNAQGMLDVLVGNYRSSLWMLMGAVGLLLVIACANVASLQLARSLGRASEFALRAALGSSRSSLVRLQLLESVVLSLSGGALGALAAFWGLDAIRLLSPATQRFQGVAISTPVLFFSLGVALVTGLASGVWPAWRASRVDLREAMQSGSAKDSTGGVSQSGRQSLVALQVALTVMLLAGAGLFARSLQRIQAFQFGFDPHNLLLLRVSVPEQAGPYSDAARRIAAFEAMRTKLAQLPGVASVGMNYSAPLRTLWSTVFDLAGRPAFAPGAQPAMEIGIVDENYSATLGLPILRGRNFNSSDRADAPAGLIIDQRFAETMWPSEDPLGKVVLQGLQTQPLKERQRVVVGVVPTIAIYGLNSESNNFQGYLAQSQEASSEMFFFLRTDVAPRSLIEAARAAVASVDPDIPISSAQTMEEMIAANYSSQTLYSRLVVLFAAVALLLAALGLYGIVTHSVNTRRREIGIRMALGALHRQVVALILRQGIAPMLAGLAIGIAASLLCGRLVANLLYRTSPADPVALALACAALLTVGVLALWLPSRRAAKVDPMIALRAE